MAPPLGPGSPGAGPRLPAGHVAGSPRHDDAAEVATLLAAYELAHEGAATTTAEGLVREWAGADLAADSVLVRGPDGRAVALLDTVPSRAQLLSAYAFVAPGVAEADAIAAYLAGWAEARASRLAAGAPVTLRNYVPAGDATLAGLLAGRGYGLARTVYRMEAELAAPPPVPAWPAGVGVRDYRGAADEPAAYEAFELGSTGMWGRPGNTFEQWLGHVAGMAGEVRLAEAAGEVVGVSIVRAAADAGGAGLVRSLRVVPAWRRRGLGAALLAEAFRACFAAGRRRVALTVDGAATTGAPELYLRAGMRVTRRYLVLERSL